MRNQQQRFRPRWQQHPGLDADLTANRLIRKLREQEHDHKDRPDMAALAPTPGFRSKLTGFVKVPPEPKNGHYCSGTSRKQFVRMKARVTLAPSPWK